MATVVTETVVQKDREAMQPQTHMYASQGSDFMQFLIDDASQTSGHATIASKHVLDIPTLSQYIEKVNPVAISVPVEGSCAASPCGKVRVDVDAPVSPVGPSAPSSALGAGATTKGPRLVGMPRATSAGGGSSTSASKRKAFAFVSPVHALKRAASFTTVCSTKAASDCAGVEKVDLTFGDDSASVGATTYDTTAQLSEGEGVGLVEYWTKTMLPLCDVLAENYDGRTLVGLERQVERLAPQEKEDGTMGPPRSREYPALLAYLNLCHTSINMLNRSSILSMCQTELAVA